MLDPLERAAQQSALHGAGDDLLQALPVQAEQPGGGCHALRGLQHADGESFKEQREAAVRPGPRHGHRLDPVLRTAHPQQAGHQQGFKTHRTEMPPAPLRRVVMEPAAARALRALKARLALLSEVNLQALLHELQIHAPHHPRVLQSQHRRIVPLQLIAIFKLLCLHPCLMPPLSRSGQPLFWEKNRGKGRLSGLCFLFFAVCRELGLVGRCL